MAGTRTVDLGGQLLFAVPRRQAGREFVDGLCVGELGYGDVDPEPIDRRTGGDQLRHPRYEKPELLAKAPNELWSWDIERHEALSNRVVMQDHHGRPIAVGRNKLGAGQTLG